MRRVLGRVFLLLLGALSGLLLAELLCRLVGLGSPVDGVDVVMQWEPPTAFVSDPDPRVGHHLRPGYVGTQVYRRASDGVTIWAKDVHLSPEGLRNPVRFPERPRRILAVGDSTTFGLGVADDESWPAALQALLGEDTEVLNAGVPGWNLAQASTWLRRDGFALAPSLVLSAFYLNDLLPSVMSSVDVAFPPTTYEAPPWARREAGFRRTSWLYNEGWRLWEREKLAEQLLGGSRSYVTDLLRTFRREDLEREYGALQRSCQQRKVRCVVVILPIFDALGSEAEAGKLLDLVETVAVSQGLPVARADRCLDNLELPLRFVLPGERHGSAMANRRVAEVVGAAIGSGAR